MRAFEITMLLIFILTAPSLIQAMGVLPANAMTCDTDVCAAQNWIHDFASKMSLPAIDLNANLATIGWDIVTFTTTFPLYAFFWMLYFLSIVTLIQPALVTMFHVPADLAIYLNIGVIILWLVAYIQWKRGGLGIDAYR